MAEATNSGPLSLRMYLGAPRWRTSLDSTSIITGDSGLAIVLETSIP
nr:hypothetical protein [Myxococcus xanthus]